jgi:hypothetical protein
MQHLAACLKAAPVFSNHRLQCFLIQDQVSDCPKKPLEINDEVRDKLQTLTRRPKSPQAIAMRTRITFSCGKGMSNSQVARRPHVTAATLPGQT